MNSITYKQYCEWKYYLSTHPVDFESANLLNGSLLAFLYNVLCRSKGDEAKNPQDFMLTFDNDNKSNIEKALDKLNMIALLNQ